MKKSLVIASSILALSLSASPMVSFAEETPTNSMEVVPNLNTTTNTVQQQTDVQQTQNGQEAQPVHPWMQQFNQQINHFRQQLKNEEKILHQQDQRAIRNFTQLIKEKIELFKLRRSKEALLELGKMYQQQGDDTIKAFANGQPLSFDVPPMVKNGRTLVPIRAISESLGATVKWDPATKTVNVTKDSNTVVLVMGSQDAVVNGVVKHVNAPPFSLRGRTLVPLRFISEALGVSINWQKEGNIITIDNGTPAPAPTGTTDTTGSTSTNTAGTASTNTTGSTSVNTTGTTSTGTTGSTSVNTAGTTPTDTTGSTSTNTTGAAPTVTTGSTSTNTTGTTSANTTGTTSTDTTGSTSVNTAGAAPTVTTGSISVNTAGTTPTNTTGTGTVTNN